MSSDSWSAPRLLQVGPGLAREAAMLARALHAAWPGGGRVYTVLPPAADPSGLDSPILCSSSGWVSMLAESLDRLRAADPGLTHVFTLIDDHCPLTPCDPEALDRVLRAAREADLACVSCVTYAWPWDRSETASRDARGRTMTWSEIRIVHSGGTDFAEVPADFFRYNQCQPSLWRLDYLRGLCAEALDRGIDDPWTFEAELYPGQRPHFVSALSWPSVHHGFLAEGRVNPEALFLPAPPTGDLQALRRYLRRRFRHERGPFSLARERMNRAWHAARFALGRWRRRLA